MITFQALKYIEGNDPTGRLIWNYATETLIILKKMLNPDCIIQLTSRKVRTHGSHKTSRTWENFNNQGTKMILSNDYD